MWYTVLAGSTRFWTWIVQVTGADSPGWTGGESLAHPCGQDPPAMLRCRAYLSSRRTEGFLSPGDKPRAGRLRWRPPAAPPSGPGDLPHRPRTPRTRSPGSRRAQSVLEQSWKRGPSVRFSPAASSALLLGLTLSPPAPLHECHGEAALACARRSDPRMTAPFLPPRCSSASSPAARSGV